MQVQIPIELLLNTILTGAVGWIVKSVLDELKSYRRESKQWRSDMDEKVDSINNATQANMRTNILHYCEKYLSRGWVTTEELRSLVDLHEKYTTLNDHNGFINGYMARVQQLEIREI
jgi:hypothetical protein